MQTVFSICPISEAAKKWLDENTQAESWNWLGSSLVVEHRYIADIVAGMMEAGLIPNRDFRVS